MLSENKEKLKALANYRNQKYKQYLRSGNTPVQSSRTSRVQAGTGVEKEG
jgi:hypothetical protein